MQRSPACTIAILFLSWSTLLFAQGPPAIGGSVSGIQAPAGPSSARPGVPARDNTRGPLTGTARMSGRVLSAETGEPLRRAQIQVMANEIGVRRVVTTDADGRFELVELPAGRYTLFANKGGYVSMQYGQRRPYESGTPVVLNDGQSLAQLEMRLPRGGVISGRISDEFGEPLAQAQVMAQRYQYLPGGQRRLTMAGIPVQTDDLGQFRIFGLAPGEYVFSAAVRALILGPGVPNPNDTNEGYPPTFYPGTTNPGDAQTVPIAAGQEVSLSMSLLPARMLRVSGTVVDSQGKPVVGSMVMLRTMAGMAMTGVVGGQTGPDGVFSLMNVSPGEHYVDVRGVPRGPDSRPESASVPVVVSNADITGLRIVTGRGATVSGRVMFQGTSPRTGGQTPLRVMAQNSDPNNPMISFVGDPIANGTVDDDGNFEIGGVMGKVFFRAITPPGWTVKSVTLEGQDIIDEPFDTTGKESVSGLRVVLTDKLTDVSGRVTDARGQVLKDYVVLIVPVEKKEAGAAVRFFRNVRPDQQARFSVRGLPPGRYTATALASHEQGHEWVPEFQEQLRGAGQGFAVREGESITLDLKLAEGL